MKGKFVNLLMGFLNLMVGILIIVFTYKVPKDLTVLTVQESEVIEGIKIAIFVIIFISVFMNILGFSKNKLNEGLKFGYKLFLFTLSFVFIQETLIAVIPIISAGIIIKNILRENLREVESTFAISVILVIIFSTIVADILIYFYGYLGSYILAKKNENQIKYSESYFKYITPLEGYDKYINVKKDGKYGYIDTHGQVVIDYQYDFATPFVTIKSYGKEFQIALVCKDGVSEIILKNQRVVKSYVSESPDENYEAKFEELEDFYKNTLKMENEMQFEILHPEINLNKAFAYDDDSEKYTYRYDYNDEYDIIVTQSSMGLKDTYALAKKDNLDYQINLDCEYLDYDENCVYLYNDGTIPFYNKEKGEQGWFSERGVRKSMKGNAQILEKIEDIFLYKNYNKNAQISFVNQKGEILSEPYKEVYIQEGRYIVKKLNDKYSVIDSNYNQIFENEYDYVDISLLDAGVYLFGNIGDVIDKDEFNSFNYANLNFIMLDYDGNIICDNLQQVYSKFYKIDNNVSKPYVSRYNDFIKNLEQIQCEFVGDKFYKK